MSKDTWQKMVTVVVPKPKRKTQRPVLPVRCVREEHYELLAAAGY